MYFVATVLVPVVVAAVEGRIVQDWEDSHSLFEFVVFLDFGWNLCWYWCWCYSRLN